MAGGNPLLYCAVAAVLFATVVCAAEPEQAADDAAVPMSGPNQWVNSNLQFAFCSSGLYQSPIEIITASQSPRQVINPSTASEKDAQQPLDMLTDRGLQCIMTSYAPTPVHFVNDGRVMRLVVEMGSVVRYENHEYELQEVLIHLPSEHIVDGVKAAAEFQLIHVERETGLYLGIASFVTPGKEHTGLAEILRFVPKDIGETHQEDVTVDTTMLLPDNPNYFRYDGSLSVPPCAEGAMWLVMKHPLELSTEQLYDLNDRLVTKNNARPLQKLNSRMVIQSDMPDDSSCPESHFPDGFCWRCKASRLCLLDAMECKHNSVLDSQQCTCTNCTETASPIVSRKPRWTGDTCDVCGFSKADCRNNGQFEVDGCKCICSGQWTGKLCETCRYSQGDCKMGTVLDPSQCICLTCPDPWVGHLCDQCSRKDASCLNGGKLDPLSCKCVECNKGWVGSQCETCTLTDFNCQHAGKANLQTCSCTGCDPGWGGRYCDECTYTSANCRHGGYMDPHMCRCLKCLPWWSGQFCDKCDRAAAMCQHGARLNTATCQCDIGCPQPYLGVYCGACPLSQADCKHGSLLHPDSCSCQLCNAKWTGERCDVCNRKDYMCKSPATINLHSCRCVNCPEPWTGELCEQCTRTQSHCKHGGHVDPVQCECVACDSPWEGPDCNHCPYTDEDCFHGGKIDAETCTCTCPEPWGGVTCTTCLRSDASCVHGGVLDPHLCRCMDCPDPWDGDLCEVCTRSRDDCQHGGKFVAEACRCDNCEQPWFGELCHVCGRKQEECLHGSRLDTLECKCSQACPSAWTGPVCGECALDSALCQHGSTFDQELCSCVDCPYPWQGVYCDYCPRSDVDCLHGGRMAQDTCQCLSCAHPWTGDLCSICQLTCSHKGVVHEEDCSCGCQWPWTNELPWNCDKCAIGQADCLNGGKFNAATCQCEGCTGGSFGPTCASCPKSKEGDEAVCGEPRQGTCHKGLCKCSRSFAGRECDDDRITAMCSFTTNAHVSTFDGEPYDWYYGGQFVAYINRDDEEEVNVALNQDGKVAKTAGFAGRYRDENFSYLNGACCINGQTFSCNKPPTGLFKNGLMYRWMGSGPELVFPSGTAVKMVETSNVFISARAQKGGEISGLCGNFNGVGADDFDNGSPGYLANKKKGDWTMPDGFGRTLQAGFDDKNNLFKCATRAEVSGSIGGGSTAGMQCADADRAARTPPCQQMVGEGNPTEIENCVLDCCARPEKCSVWAALQLQAACQKAGSISELCP